MSIAGSSGSCAACRRAISRPIAATKHSASALAFVACRGLRQLTAAAPRRAWPPRSLRRVALAIFSRSVPAASTSTPLGKRPNFRLAAAVLGPRFGRDGRPIKSISESKSAFAAPPRWPLLPRVRVRPEQKTVLLRPAGHERRVERSDPGALLPAAARVRQLRKRLRRRQRRQAERGREIPRESERQVRMAALLRSVSALIVTIRGLYSQILRRIAAESAFSIGSWPTASPASRIPRCNGRSAQVTISHAKSRTFRTITRLNRPPTMLRAEFLATGQPPVVNFASPT